MNVVDLADPEEKSNKEKLLYATEFDTIEASYYLPYQSFRTLPMWQMIMVVGDVTQLAQWQIHRHKSPTPTFCPLRYPTLLHIPHSNLSSLISQLTQALGLQLAFHPQSQ